jgi:hypothetical protein
MSWGDLRDVLAVRPLTERLPAATVQYAPFRAAFSDTARLLEREVGHLAPREVILEAGFTDGQLRLDGMPRADARPAVEGVILTVIRPRGITHDLRYPCSTFGSWQANLRAIALSLEALRKVNRYGVSKRGEQYAGWKALPAGAPSDDDLVEKGRRIVTNQYGGDILRARIDTHPDRGGTHERFIAVQAYIEARA